MFFFVPGYSQLGYVAENFDRRKRGGVWAVRITLATGDAKAHEEEGKITDYLVR